MTGDAMHLKARAEDARRMADSIAPISPTLALRFRALALELDLKVRALVMAEVSR